MIWELFGHPKESLLRFDSLALQSMDRVTRACIPSTLEMEGEDQK